ATTTVYPSPLNDPGGLTQLLPAMLDKLTTVADTELTPRININTAPAAVLAAIPGLTADQVQALVAERPNPAALNAGDPTFQTPAWLITVAGLKPNTVKQMEKYITARTQVYRVQVVGYFDRPGPVARVEAVIDTNNGRPRIVYWRDLTELGKGFDLS